VVRRRNHDAVHTVEKVVTLDWMMTLETRRDLFDRLLDPLPENAEDCAPRAARLLVFPWLAPTNRRPPRHATGRRTPPAYVRPT
jgi:hypothetical protein